MTYLQKSLKENFGNGITTIMSVNAMGKLLGLPIIYFLFEFFGYGGIFVVCGIFNLAMLLIFMLSRRSEKELLIAEPDADADGGKAV